MNTIIVYDYSDDTGFEFGFACGLCGYRWTNKRIPFDLGNLSDIQDKKELELLRAEERRKAYEQARQEAATQFNRCPECGIWVCDECFYVANEEFTDYCMECVEELRA